MLSEIIKALGSTAQEYILKLLLQKLVSLMPFLSFGPLNYVLSWYLQKRIKQLIDLGELGVIDFFIASSVSNQKDKLVEAIDMHNKIKESGNINEILVSEENLKSKLRDFIKLNN